MTLIQWAWKTFDELTLEELYTLLSARQSVFVVEQNCPYLDADNGDHCAHHLLGWSSHKQPSPVLAAYLRILPPDSGRKEAAIGRILTTAAFRGQGLGKDMIQEALTQCRQLFPEKDVYMSAQHHLQAFYEEFGFQAEGDMYKEDGIPHIDMYLRRTASP